MRYLIAILALWGGLQPINAQEPPVSPTPDALTRPAATPADILADDLWRIAVAFHVPIGFESAEQTIIPGALNQVPTLGSRTLTEALDAAIGSDNRYEWRPIDDVIVVRPKRAWTTAADPLNRQVRNLQTIGVSPTAVLLGLRDLVYTNRFVVSHRLSGAVSLHVASGTVLDVLNQLTLASDQVMWLAFYRGSDGQPDNRDWGLRFELRNAKHVTGVAAGRPLVSPGR